jgi:hypothetical protein
MGPFGALFHGAGERVRFARHRAMVACTPPRSAPSPIPPTRSSRTPTLASIDTDARGSARRVARHPRAHAGDDQRPVRCVTRPHCRLRGRRPAGAAPPDPRPVQPRPAAPGRVAVVAGQGGRVAPRHTAALSNGRQDSADRALQHRAHRPWSPPSRRTAPTAAGNPQRNGCKTLEAASTTRFWGCSLKSLSIGWPGAVRNRFHRARPLDMTTIFTRQAT